VPLGIDPELLGDILSWSWIINPYLRRHYFRKVQILQDVDKVFIDGLKSWGLYDKVWQAGAILLPVNSVGVMGDERTYEK
jgi:GMP synthase (glutamine-hydrolysing)